MIQQTLAVSSAILFTLSLPFYENQWTNGISIPDTDHTSEIAITNDTIEQDSGQTVSPPPPARQDEGSTDWSESHREIDPRLTVYGLSSCRVTQDDTNHHTQSWWSMYAIDIGCWWGSYDVPAPNIKPFYEVQFVGEDKYLGTYIIIKHGDERWIYGHTQTSRLAGERIEAGDILGQSNDTGYADGIHTHIEYWKATKNISEVWEANDKSDKLCDQRGWQFCKISPLETYYFTHYDLGDISQNDSAPCHGASGADLCWLAREWVATMALTSDIREKLWVVWGDKVILEWDEWCRGIYEVHDEMNKRFRTGCVKRHGTNICIKGDLPGKPGGACTVKKITY